MSWVKRFIGSAYSMAADRVYEPIVVKGTFKVFGGNLNELAVAQGRRAAEVAEGGPILDMPVGTAYFTTKLARAHEGLVVGSDIAWGMVVRSMEAADEQAIPNLHCVQADAHALPFPNDTFAAVMCTNGLQVIPGLAPTIAELARVTRPEGYLFVSVLTLAAPRVVREMRRDMLPTIMLSGDEIAAAIESSGLEVKVVRTERLATLIEAVKLPA